MSSKYAGSATIQRRDCGLGNYGTFRNVRRFGSLDGWRAIAILAVIWHHTAASSFLSGIFDEGRQGVNLFFVISGFLIVTLILRERDTTGRFSLSAFWRRRILRIFPVYYLVLGIYTVLVLAIMHTPAGHRFLFNLRYFATFTSNWGVDAAGETIFFFAWSVALEEQFYLVWPVIESAIKIPSVRVALLTGATCLVFVCGYLGAEPGANGVIQVIGRIPPTILFGTLLAYILHYRRSYEIAARVLGRRGSALGCLLITAAAVATGPSLGQAGDSFIFLSFAALIGACVIREDNDLAPVLQWRPLVWIGTVSYGMYMVHMLAANVVTRVFAKAHLDGPLTLFAGTAALACVLASISLVFYERPFLKLKQRATPRRSSFPRAETLGGPTDVRVLAPAWLRRRP